MTGALRHTCALVHCPQALLLLFSPGVATYTDKLFKFRNNRWEDILSDEVNVARGVASLFAGRSVACVDRTVSSGVHGGMGKCGGTQQCEGQEGSQQADIHSQSVSLEGRAQGCTLWAAPSVPCA